MNSYLKNSKVIYRVAFFIFLSSLVSAQNSSIESRPQEILKIKNIHHLPHQEFSTSLTDEIVPPLSRKYNTIGSKIHRQQTLLANNKYQTFSNSIWQAWVKHYGPELESVYDRAFDLAVDKSGNIYITGSSDGDYITIKYNSTGTQQWIKYFSGPGVYSDDIATTIVTDNAGNIYVSGYSDRYDGGYSSGYDYLTIKYDTLGNEQWSVYYDANTTFFAGYDKVFMAADSMGNVYVASTNNYLLIKYNAEGTEQWVNHTSKEISFTDMAIDSAGYVYVVGNGWEGSLDFFDVAKFNSNGEELWIAEDNDIVFEHSTAITADDWGNVYVAGFGMFNSNINYIILKYDSSGIEQWTVNYNGPENSSDYANDVIADTSGNIYLTGQSGNSCVTIKYNSSGIEQWAASCSIANYKVGGEKISIDLNRNIYVSGYSYPSDDMNSLDYLTIMYNAAGEEQWVNFYSKHDSSSDQFKAMEVDESGSVYITGMSYDEEDLYDCVTVKYDVSGNEQWVAIYDTPKNAYAGAKAITADQSGNVYVTGGYANGGYSENFITVKYNPTGEELWIADSYNGWGKDIAVDASGNVYVTGIDNSRDYLTIKYNTDGIEQWVARYDGPANNYDEVTALALDSFGNVYITGGSWAGTDTLQSDYATVKYNSSGIKQWVARYNGTSNITDFALAIAVDIHENVYVTGKSWNSGTSKDMVTIKYNKFGEEQWVAKYNRAGYSQDEGRDIAIDMEGNVYVVGNTDSSGTGLNYLTIKYDTSGVEQWVAQYNGPANMDDEANSIAIDKYGNIYVTGFSNDSDTTSDFTTIKYNPAGEEQWVAKYSGTENGNDKATELTIDKTGNIYVTGSSEGSGTLYDIVTIKYDPEGNTEWVTRFNDPELPDDYATALAVDSSGNVYVAGYSGSEELRGGYYTYIGIGNKSSKITVIKYSNEPLSVEPGGTNSPLSFRLEQNYPNPFNPTTQIEYALPTNENISIEVYNLLGQKVTTLFQGLQKAGTHKVLFDGSGLTSGVYFYRLQIKDFSQTKKFLLLK
jgi:uncharacterized delta-60 repeat protein